jgi:tRNA(adenine34) deaminase
VYGASDEKRGYSKINNSVLHPSTEIFSGVLEEECKQLLLDFFKQKRD